MPCFAEQYNEFKYLYSLKKEAGAAAAAAADEASKQRAVDKNADFFRKFTVIDLHGTLVGIKVLVSQSYICHMFMCFFILSTVFRICNVQSLSVTPEYLNEMRLSALERALAKIFSTKSR